METHGYCKECGNKVYKENRVSWYDNVGYECEYCLHINSEEDLWDDMIAYLSQEIVGL